LKLSVASREDFLSGLLFVALGVGALWVSRDYPFGGLTQLASGFFPVILSVLLTALGVCICAAALLGRESAAELPRLPVGQAARPLFYVLLALAVFAVLARPLGLAIATVALVLIGSRAERGFPLSLAVPLSFALAAMAVGIFVYGLGLPFRIWP
jgi:hypothetical protein